MPGSCRLWGLPWQFGMSMCWGRHFGNHGSGTVKFLICSRSPHSWAPLPCHQERRSCSAGWRLRAPRGLLCDGWPSFGIALGLCGTVGFLLSLMDDCYQRPRLCLPGLCLRSVFPGHYPGLCDVLPGYSCRRCGCCPGGPGNTSMSGSVFFVQDFLKSAQKSIFVQSRSDVCPGSLLHCRRGRLRPSHRQGPSC